MDRDDKTLSEQDQQDQKNVSVPDEDIHDSPRDEERLKPDVAVIDLPEVDDIPGQEHVHVPPLGELGDTTAASDDEEGRDVLGD